MSFLKESENQSKGAKSLLASSLTPGQEKSTKKAVKNWDAAEEDSRTAANDNAVETVKSTIPLEIIALLKKTSFERV
jgi:hypothetical protein